MFKRILKWLGAITVLRQGLRQQSFVYDSDAHAANPFTRKDIKTIDLVRRTFDGVLVDLDCGFELLLLPTLFDCQLFVDPTGHFAFAAASHHDLTLFQFEP